MSFLNYTSYGVASSFSSLYDFAFLFKVRDFDYYEAARYEARTNSDVVARIITMFLDRQKMERQV